MSSSSHQGAHVRFNVADPSGNGTGRHEFTIQMLERPSTGHIIFRADEKRPPIPEDLPEMLSNSLQQHLDNNPQLRVYSALPNVKDGHTIEIHLWCDPATME